MYIDRCKTNQRTNYIYIYISNAFLENFSRLDPIQLDALALVRSRDLGIEKGIALPYFLFFFFFSFWHDRLARLAAMTRATFHGRSFFLSSRRGAGEHRRLIVLIRAISSAREQLSSGLRVTITVPTGSKWWIEHAGVTTSPLKRAPSSESGGSDYRRWVERGL